MTDKQTLQKQIDDLKKVLSSPKTQGATKNLLTVGLKKAEAKMEELNKATKLEKSDKELTPKQEDNIEQTKKETSSLAKSLKEKVAKAKQIIAKTTPKPATKKGGAKSVAKAKEKAKERRSTQKNQSLKDNDIEKDAVRYAISKVKRRSQGGRANQYGTKAENKGGTYYERRENRYDVQNKRYAKLEDGGETFAEGGGIRFKEGWYAVGEPVFYEGSNKWGQEIYYLSNKNNYVSHDAIYKNSLSELNEKLQEYGYRRISKEDLIMHMEMMDKREKGNLFDSGGYNDFGYHVINDEVTLKNGKKVFVTKGRYYSSNELGDNKPSGVYYLTNDRDFIKDSEINFPLNKMSNGGMANLSRDRMFKSQQGWEQDYQRKTRPRNPHYRKFEDGGGIDLLSDTSGAGLQNVGGTSFSNVDLTPHMDITNPIFAQGGILEHGLKIGDKIIDVSDIDSSSIRVMNDGKYAYVNLSKGTRTEAMAYGGYAGQDSDLKKKIDEGRNVNQGTRFMSSSGMKYANGGGIPNNYRGRTTEDIWNNLTEDQRTHFLIDHSDEMNLNNNSLLVATKQEFKDLSEDVQDAFKGHTLMGQYEDGGMMASGGRITKGAKYMTKFRTTNGDSGYSILEVVDTNYFSNKYGGSPNTIRTKVIESSHEKVGSFDEDSRKQIQSNLKNGFWTKLENYADGGMMNNGGEVNKYSKIFDELKKGDKIKISFSSGIKNSNEKDLLVLSKNTVGKGKSFESEKITFKNLENPDGVRYYAYKRKSGFVSFAMGDLAISNVEISFANKMAKGGVLNKKVNEKIKGYLDDSSASPMHQWEVKTILQSALIDANFHSASKKVNDIFPKAKFDSVKYSKTFEEFLTEKLEGMGKEIAKMSEYDGNEIINAIAFYVSMNMGRPLGQKVESLKNSMAKGGGIFGGINEGGYSSMKELNQDYKRIITNKERNEFETSENTYVGKTVTIKLPNMVNSFRMKVKNEYATMVSGSGKNGGVYDKKYIISKGEGGTTTFNDKVKSIAKNLLKKKKVSPSVQKDYGKTYDKKEAVDSAKRIVGAMKKKAMAKGSKLKIKEDDFSFLNDLTDKELSKRLDLVKKQQDINAKQYFSARDKKESTTKIEESRKKLDNQERAIIEARLKVNKKKS